MLIIIEGVDGTGKTTVCDELKKLSAAKVMHAAQPKGDYVQEYIEPLNGYVPVGAYPDGDRTQPTHVICDRWHWGELIYGPLYRGGSILDDDAWVHVNQYLNALGAIIVYLRNDKQTILSRWEQRGEDFAKAEHLDWLMSAYERVAAASTVPVLRMTGDIRRGQYHRILSVALGFEQCMADERRRAVL